MGRQVVQVLAVQALLYLCVQAGLEDCIAEKYYRYTPDHTACVVKSSNAQSSGVTEDDKTTIVDRHNQLRAQQGAANMQKMVWDDDAAAIAQRWTDNCDFSHDDYRRIPGRFSLGQNLGYGYDDFESLIDAWYDEIADFTYGDESANTFSNVGHYTQLVWAESAKVGCGYTYCTNLNAALTACNYGPAGNLDWWEPYVQGSPCANCPNSCNEDNLCDCGGKVCENGGTLDIDTCQCSCPEPWHIAGTCALNCSLVVEPSACSPGGAYYEKCFIYTNVPDECPNHCNICPYSDYEVSEGSGGNDGGDNSASLTGSSIRLLGTAGLLTIAQILI